MDLFGLAKYLYEYLVNAGVEFMDNGYPVISENMILREMPEQVLPINHRYASKNRKKTLLVTFTNDEYVYKRLLSLDKEIPMYKEYLGFGGFDLSPRINWDIGLQKFNILLCRMADVYIALHGIKLLPNFRTGSLATFDVLNCYPKDSWYIVGTLGCSNGHIELNRMYLRTKLIIANPEMLIYYGILKKEYEDVLDDYGVQYRVFPDYQRLSRGKGSAA